MARRKKPEPWSDEVGWAKTICAPLGCAVERSPHMYEIATVKGDGVQLIIYPHRTTAGHYHARVRNNGSKDKAKAERVLRALDEAEGLPSGIRDRVRFSCTFGRKNR